MLSREESMAWADRTGQKETITLLSVALGLKVVNDLFLEFSTWYFWAMVLKPQMTKPQKGKLQCCRTQWLSVFYILNLVAFLLVPAVLPNAAWAPVNFSRHILHNHLCKHRKFSDTHYFEGSLDTIDTTVHITCKLYKYSKIWKTSDSNMSGSKHVKASRSNL